MILHCETKMSKLKNLADTEQGGASFNLAFFKMVKTIVSLPLYQIQHCDDLHKICKKSSVVKKPCLSYKTLSPKTWKKQVFRQIELFLNNNH